MSAGSALLLPLPPLRPARSREREREGVSGGASACGRKRCSGGGTESDRLCCRCCCCCWCCCCCEGMCSVRTGVPGADCCTSRSRISSGTTPKPFCACGGGNRGRG